jgi:hypothetical protein
VGADASSTSAPLGSASTTTNNNGAVATASSTATAATGKSGANNDKRVHAGSLVMGFVGIVGAMF